MGTKIPTSQLWDVGQSLPAEMASLPGHSILHIAQIAIFTLLSAPEGLAMLNTVHLNTFLTIVELGTYSAAAEYLHLTQPAISQQISTLEKQLGDVRLFRRVAQRMMLTHAGEELLPAAREIVGLAERTEQTLLALRGQVGGRVVIACTPSSGERLLPRVVQRFQQQFSQIKVVLEVGSVRQILAGLEAGHIQIGWLDEAQRRRGWESVCLGREPLACGVAADHPWRHTQQVTIGMIAEQALIVPPRGTATRRSIDETLRRAGLGEYQIALETESIAATIAAIRDGVGTGFVPLSCQPAPRDMEFVSLSGVHLSTTWYMVGLKDAALNRAVQECRSFLASSEVAQLLQTAGISPDRP